MKFYLTHLKKTKPVCLIPARLGSKRIKNKNIIKISKTPLIGHVIKTALKSKLFSKVVVSTDSKKIAKIAKSYGAIAPFLRSKKLSNSNTGIKETLVDCINQIKTFHIEHHFCIYPTAILITKKDLTKAFKKIKKVKADALFAVYENSSLMRSFKYNKKRDVIDFKWKKYSQYMSQDLPKIYSDTGTFFIFNTKKYLASKKILSKKTIPYEISKIKGIDLNTKDDLELLKAAYSFNIAKRTN